MDESTNPAQSKPDDPPLAPAISNHQIRASRDWLMLGFLALILALATLVALLILIAYENGTAA